MNTRTEKIHLPGCPLYLELFDERPPFFKISRYHKSYRCTHLTPSQNHNLHRYLKTNETVDVIQPIYLEFSDCCFLNGNNTCIYRCLLNFYKSPDTCPRKFFLLTTKLFSMLEIYHRYFYLFFSKWKQGVYTFNWAVLQKLLIFYVL